MFTPKTSTAYVILIDNQVAAITRTAPAGDSIEVSVYGSATKEDGHLYVISKEEEDGSLYPIAISYDYEWASKIADRISCRSNCTTLIDEHQMVS